MIRVCTDYTFSSGNGKYLNFYLLECSYQIKSWPGEPHICPEKKHEIKLIINPFLRGDIPKKLSEEISNSTRSPKSYEGTWILLATLSVS